MKNECVSCEDIGLVIFVLFFYSCLLACFYSGAKWMNAGLPGSFGKRRTHAAMPEHEGFASESQRKVRGPHHWPGCLSLSIVSSFSLPRRRTARSDFLRLRCEWRTDVRAYVCVCVQAPERKCHKRQNNRTTRYRTSHVYIILYKRFASNPLIKIMQKSRYFHFVTFSVD